MPLPMRFGFCESPMFRLYAAATGVNGAPVAKNACAGELPSAHKSSAQPVRATEKLRPPPMGSIHENEAVTT